MNLRDLQAEVGEWHREHFPEATATNIVLKAVEEVGELAKAHNRNLLGRADSSFLDEEDAVGDIIIVLLALCEKWNMSFAEIVAGTWAEVRDRDAERIRR